MIRDIKQQLQELIGSDFLVHSSTPEWGDSLWVMSKDGFAFSRTYTSDESDGCIYFSELNVEEQHRGNGYASKMLKSHIQLSEKLGLDSYLFCKSGTWMYDWYIRNGYEYHAKYECDDDRYDSWLVRKTNK